METDALPPRWTVELPLHVGWSGRRVYDVGEEVLYALLLAEAQREDLEQFVHCESLVSMWPKLRQLLGPHARRQWEQRLMAPGNSSQDLDFATGDVARVDDDVQDDF